MSLRRTITFPEKELQEELTKLQERFEAYERFEDDIRDAMDFMDSNESTYILLNEALRRLQK